MSDALPLSDSNAAGPTVVFGFNLGKIPGHGEDSDPIMRDGPDLGLIGVFDGMGGAGGTVYETDEGARTGAYLASRIAKDVVEQRMLELLEPDWNLKGEAAAEDLRRSVKTALEERLRSLKAPTSRLRSRLLRALPTTMAVIALQRTHRRGSTWTCHVFWAGDSRAYAFMPDGARQLSTDDLRDSNDALANLHQDSVVSNAMSADTEFHVSYRRVDLQAPFLLVCATDGCFGYVPTPMHFEHLVLSTLRGARSPDAWSRAVQDQVAEVTGDDAAMSTMAVGSDLDGLQVLFADRTAELEGQYIVPLDGSSQAVAEAERRLEAAREHHRQLTADVWGRYKPQYERHLGPEPQLHDEDDDRPADAAADETPLDPALPDALDEPEAARDEPEGVPESEQAQPEELTK